MNAPTPLPSPGLRLTAVQLPAAVGLAELAEEVATAGAGACVARARRPRAQDVCLCAAAVAVALVVLAVATDPEPSAVGAGSAIRRRAAVVGTVALTACAGVVTVQAGADTVAALAYNEQASVNAARIENCQRI